jgi:uncharacterized protein YndB with AHSA1/START domain
MTPGPFAELINDDLGRVIARGDGLYDIVLERRLKKSVEKVWAAITIPERIACWFAEVELEPRVGGRYKLYFLQNDYGVDGEITAFEPLRLLAHTWPTAQDRPASIVRYELEPDGEGCRLTLTQAGLDKASLVALPGWHAFLEALPGAAEGVHTEWTWDREKAIGERYKDVIPA